MPRADETRARAARWAAIATLGALATLGLALRARDRPANDPRPGSASASLSPSPVTGTGADGGAAEAAPPPAKPRALVRGDRFPEGVLALTWDDGPDVETLELARWLRREEVSATFFVVGEWVAGVSSDPGVGPAAMATGYLHLPILGQLVDLGHRIGAHTRNHVLLGDATTATVTEQLVPQITRDLAPFFTSELRIFRAPGGSFGANASRALDVPELADLVGPVHWDVDAKDWDGSLACRDAPAADCEPGPTGPRLRPTVVARRYLAQIETHRRGIVLFHDRVGDVGRGYARDLARRIVPELRRLRFVFAAPVLEFGDVVERAPVAGAHRLGDVDGDRRPELCEVAGSSIRCASSRSRPVAFERSRMVFDVSTPTVMLTSEPGSFALADVDGDQVADMCILGANGGVDCAVNRPTRTLEAWSAPAVGRVGPLQLADVDGDGRADACLDDGAAILCAKSTGKRFGQFAVWAATRPPGSASLVLADVDGDRRADACVRTTADGGGVDCALSRGDGFLPFRRWSAAGDFVAEGPILLGDLNGDRRADACTTTEGEAGASSARVRCALSRGDAFLQASTWATLPAHSRPELADVNGDGRADLCEIAGGHLACGLAP